MVCMEQKGNLCNDYVRYPVGIPHRKLCKFALNTDSNGVISTKRLDYVESRKEIYVADYVNNVVNKEDFLTLKKDYIAVKIY